MSNAIADETRLDDLKVEISYKRAILVIGAGVSIGASKNALAGWAGLLNDGITRTAAYGRPLPHEGWCRRQQEAINTGDLFDWLGVAEQIERRLRGNRQYARWIRECFRTLEAKNLEVLEAIRDLELTIATTNYDGLLEAVTHLPPVTLQDPERALRVLKREASAILHLHGHWETPDSLVLGISSYEKHIANVTTADLQRALLLYNTVVFVGFGAGLSDPNFENLRSWLCEQQHEHRHYHLIRDGDTPMSGEQEEGRPERIFAIRYGPTYDHLGPFLRSLKVARNSSGDSRDSPHLTAPNIQDQSHCFGRDAIIRQLVDALKTRAASGNALVFGGPGFGKTTVTEKVAVHDEIRELFHDRRWMIKLATLSQASELIRKIASTMGLDVTASKDVVLEELGREPSLLILDNLESLWHSDRGATASLLGELRAAPNIALIASLRSDEPPNNLSWDASIGLDVLDRETSRTAFLAIAGKVKPDDPNLDWFLDWAAGIPLATSIIAMCVAGSSDMTLLRKEWDHYGAGLIMDRETGGTDQINLEKCIECSLTSPVVMQAGRHLFSLLGKLPAGMSVEDASVLLKDDAPFAPRQLRLVGLLTERAGRFDLLPPIRQVAIEHRDESKDNLWVGHYAELVRDLFKSIGKDGNAKAMARLSEELPNVEAALSRLARKPAGRAKVVEIMVEGWSEPSFAVRLASGTLIPWLEKKCREDKDFAGLAACQIIQAHGAELQSDYFDAERKYNAARELLKDSAFPRLRAQCELGNARIAVLAEKFEQAHTHYLAARPLTEDADWRKGQADCAWGMATLAFAQHDLDVADRYYFEAEKLYDQENYLFGVAGCMWGRAEIALAQKDRVRAGDLYKQAGKRYDRVGWHTGRAFASMSLGGLAELNGNLEEARNAYATAEALFRKTWHAAQADKAARKLLKLSRGDEPL